MLCIFLIRNKKYQLNVYENESRAYITNFEDNQFTNLELSFQTLKKQIPNFFI